MDHYLRWGFLAGVAWLAIGVANRLVPEFVAHPLDTSYVEWLTAALFGRVLGR
jgi:hypothetical protein